MTGQGEEGPRSGRGLPGDPAPGVPAAGMDRAPTDAEDGFDQGAIPVVGIGASAGGIEALGRFFEAMPGDSGCAFVVVLHLDPNRESGMAQVLAGHTPMSVSQVEDGMRLAPDRVYVIAPDTELEVRDGTLHVAAPTTPRAQRHPVDVLFASLARDRHERAVAVVLSGTGSNGTEGLKEVRAEGGMSLVQDPGTATFDGMPRSAIGADLADHVLPPERMPDVILRFVRHGYLSGPADLDADASGSPSTLDRVLELIRARAGQDFRDYKKSTLRRRVHRRLGLRNVPTLDDYVVELREDPDEMQALAQDLMINVTGFFRDPDAWKALEETVVAPLVAERANGAPVRCWVAACSTGEEAYSVAIMIAEAAEAAGKRLDLKVFATDAQEENLRRAREGIFPDAAVAGFSAARLRRFFDKLDGSWQVTKELRDLVVFAAHNLLRDPPFSRLDLVSCRNFLIYLEPGAQQRVLALFHFALRPGGHLFLGNAETIGRYDDLYATVSKKWRIYRRVGPTRHDLMEYPPARGRTEPDRGDVPSLTLPRSPPSAVEIARRTLLDQYAPASVLIDRRGRVLYFHGSTRDYLEHPPGEPTRDLLTMVRDGLGARLRAAIREAWQARRRQAVDARLRENGALRSVTMTVVPVGASQEDAYLLVSFAPASSPPAPAPTASADDAGHAASSEQALQEELKAARAELQHTVEYLETANEELKAANEEATSMNEELQSTNEELETSKEELQSFNEELNTVNSQLQHKVKQLEDTTNDLNNLLSGSDVATMFLDGNLNIKWFSPATGELFDFVSSDIGRPITHFARKFTDENLLADAEAVLRRLTTIEAEVPSDAGRWYQRRMLPYRTQDNHIAGVVITFTDVTERKRAADAIDEARRYSEAIVATIRQPLLVLDRTLRVQSANRAFYELFAASEEQTVGRLVYELGNGQWNIPRLRTLLDEALSKGEELENYEIEHDFADLGRRFMVLNARKLSRNASREELILLAIEDVTERRDAERHRDLLVRELTHRVKNVLATVQAIAAQTLRSAESLDDAGSAFSARLVALGKAHDLLTRGEWVGATLDDIVAETTEPHAGGQTPFRIEGPPVTLVPNAALAIAMALQELATNAAKYGALSTEEGTVEIVWRLEGRGGDRRLALRWSEHGGPAVAPPTRSGFGSRLIQRVLAMELNGKVEVSFEPTGVVCMIDAPMPDVREEGGRADERGKAGSDR